MNIHLILSIVVIMVFFSVGVKMNRDPGSMDSWLAYRTSFARRSVDTWYESNMYAGRLLMIFASLLLMAVFLTEMTMTRVSSMLLVLCVLILISLLLIYVLTERRLRNRFFRDGKRRPASF